MNAGLKFFTPEEFFDLEDPKLPFILPYQSSEIYATPNFKTKAGSSLMGSCLNG